jgi:hypothetical protein
MVTDAKPVAVAMPATAPAVDYMTRAMNKNWPIITFFDLYGRGSALHFMFEHAGQNYNDHLI